MNERVFEINTIMSMIEKILQEANLAITTKRRGAFTCERPNKREILRDKEHSRAIQGGGVDGFTHSRNGG